MIIGYKRDSAPSRASIYPKTVQGATRGQRLSHGVDRIAASAMFFADNRSVSRV